MFVSILPETRKSRVVTFTNSLSRAHRSPLEACAVCAGRNSRNTALCVALVLGHTRYLAEPSRITDDGSTHSVLDIQVLQVLLNVRRSLAERRTFLLALCLAAEADIFGEPNRVVADSRAFVQIE